MPPLSDRESDEIYQQRTTGIRAKQARSYVDSGLAEKNFPLRVEVTKEIGGQFVKFKPGDIALAVKYDRNKYSLRKLKLPKPGAHMLNSCLCNVPRSCIKIL